MFYLLKIVIFHCYVSSPKGIYLIIYLCVCMRVCHIRYFLGSFFTCCHGLVSVRGGATLQGRTWVALAAGRTMMALSAIGCCLWDLVSGIFWAQCMISVLQAHRGSRFEFGRGTHEKSLYCILIFKFLTAHACLNQNPMKIRRNMS